MRSGYDVDGGLGDRLVAAVLRGEKTATSALLCDYEEDESPAEAGQTLDLVDSAGRHRGFVEITEVRTLPLGKVGLDVALAEGEGFQSVSDWEREHRSFWATVSVDNGGRIPEQPVSDEELVVVEFFRLIERA